MARKRERRRRPVLYTWKANQMLLSNWAQELVHLAPAQIRREIIDKLARFEADLLKLNNGEVLRNTAVVLTTARLLAAQRNAEYREALNRAEKHNKRQPKLNMDEAISAVRNMRNAVTAMNPRAWREKLEELLNEPVP